MPFRRCLLLAFAASVEISRGGASVRLAHLREGTVESARGACLDPDFCYMLTDRGIDLNVAKTCMAVESGEFYCGGRATCVAKIFTPEADLCRTDRVVCCAADDCQKTQIADQVADALKNTGGEFPGVNPACPTPEVLQTDDGMQIAKLEANKMDVKPSDTVCTEFNPSEGSRSYMDGSTVEPAEHLHIKSRLGDLSSQAWTPEVFSRGGYVQIDVQRPLALRGIVTQGGSGKYVTKYEVRTSPDGREDNYEPQGDFDGNIDDENKEARVLPLTVSANYVRIYPQQWVGGVAMRAGLVLCGPGGTSCAGGERLTVNPSASGRNYTTRWQRANDTEYGGDAMLEGHGWCAGSASKENWAEIDLSTVEKVTGFVFQGVKKPHQKDDSMITKFRYAYSYDGNVWTSVERVHNTLIDLENPDKRTTVNTPAIFAARRVRIYPEEWIGKTPCVRFGAQVCSESGDGCTGKHWCEMLLAAGGDSWKAKDALMCRVNGDLWFCSTTSDSVGVEFTSTCVGYAPEAKSDDHCFQNRMFCAGKAPENSTNPEDKTFGSLYEQAQQVIRARNNIPALGISVMHPECPQENRANDIAGASNWKWATQTTCGQSEECPEGNELLMDEGKNTPLSPIEVDSLDDVSVCRRHCEEYNVCEGFSVRTEGARTLCRLYRQTTCGRLQEDGSDCWWIEALSKSQSTMLLASNPANLDKMADSAKDAGSWEGRKPIRESAPENPQVEEPHHAAHLMVDDVGAPTPWPTGEGTPAPTPLPTEEPTPAPTLTAATAAPKMDLPAMQPPHDWAMSLKDYVNMVMGDPMTPLRNYVQTMESNREQRAEDFQNDERGEEMRLAGSKKIWKNRSTGMRQSLSDAVSQARGNQYLTSQNNKHNFREHALKIRDRQRRWQSMRRELKDWQRAAIRNTSRDVAESNLVTRKYMQKAKTNHSRWRMEQTKAYDTQLMNWTNGHAKERASMNADRMRARGNRTMGTMRHRAPLLVFKALKHLPTDQEAYEANRAAQGLDVVNKSEPTSSDRQKAMAAARVNADQVDSAAKAQQATRITSQEKADAAQAAAASKALEEGVVLPTHEKTDQPAAKVSAAAA